MHKYVALLRGINVGGNSLIKMVDLKAAFEKSGFTNVTTYINSGNVIFETNEKNIPQIITQVEKDLTKTFKLELRVVILSEEQLQNVLNNVPPEWKKRQDIRCYIAFLKDHVTPFEVAKEIKLKEGVDSIKLGTNVVYMTTKMAGLTQSGFTKLIGKPVYKFMTMRNYNTAKKLLTLMEKK